MEVLRIAWFIWSALWGVFIVSLIIFVSRWDRVATGNLIFHIVAGAICNLIFWSIIMDAHRALGLLIVSYYSYEFVWRPLTSPSRHFSHLKERLSND